MPLQITQNVAAGAGKYVDLSGSHVYVEVEGGGDCWVRACEVAEAAFSATPAPGAGASATAIHLPVAGDKTVFDLTAAANKLEPGRKIVGINIWSIDAGDHTITGPGV